MRIPGRRWWPGVAVAALALAAHGTPARAAESAWLGVYTQSLTPELRDALAHEGEGVVVNRVVSGSPADHAGIRKGDLIVRVGTRSVGSPTELAEAIQSHEAGDEVRIQVMRDGERRTLRATLSTRRDEAETRSRRDDSGTWTRRATPPAPRAPRAPQPPPSPDPDFDFDFERPDVIAPAPLIRGLGRGRLGVRIETLNRDLADYFGVEDGRGVLVLDVMKDTPAERVGIKAGDVIVRVGDRAIVDADDLVRAVGQAQGRTEVMVIRHGERRRFEAELGAGDGDRRVLRMRRIEPRTRIERPSGRRDREAMERELEALREELKELERDLDQLRDGDER